MQRWFVSHPSHNQENVSLFFRALKKFDEDNTKIELIWPPAEAMSLAERKIELDHSQLVLAEASIASTGSGIDLGLAYAAKVPIIAFRHSSGAISPIVPVIATAIHAYVSEEQILKVLQTLA